jgi:formamidopyrimidine-DNA glycosylase
VPELPEVEVVRAQLAPLVVGRTVVDAGSHPSEKFAPATEAQGASFVTVARRGKYLLLGLDDGREMVVHLGMTGGLHPRADGCDRPDPYVRAWWRLDDGTVIDFRDIRRFGRIAVVPAGDHRRLPTLHHLGPEPFDEAFTPVALWRALRRSTRPVKTQLLSQRVVAGVGNIYADEALWGAGIHPASRRVGRARAASLHDEIRRVLAQGIANGGTTLRDYRTVDGGRGANQHSLACYGRAGAGCLRCGCELRRIVVDGRGTTFCPRCQRR